MNRKMSPNRSRADRQIPPSLVAWLDDSLRSHRAAMGDRRGADMVLIMLRRLLAESEQEHLGADGH